MRPGSWKGVAIKTLSPTNPCGGDRENNGLLVGLSLNVLSLKPD
jgi:hypothetical protein